MLHAKEQCRDVSIRAPRYSKATLLEAIEEAQRRLAVDPKLTEVSVVKIVRVVRREKPVPPPVTVEIEVVD